MTIDLVVFDMAGTTVTDKNYVARAFQKAFYKADIEVSNEEVNPLMGYHKPAAIQMILERKGKEIDEILINDIYHDFVHEMIDFYEYSPYVQPMPDAEDVFFFLRERGIKIALNTGFPRSVAEVIVNRFQWTDRCLINDFIASDEVSAGRPYPYMIEELKRRNRINENATVIKVGDTIVDILEGQNAGCRYVIAATTGSATREELKQYNPTHIISSLAELPPLVKSFRQIYV